MRTSLSRFAFALAALAATAPAAAAQSPAFYAEMHWREIGPTRAGRARALSGVPSQPNVFYIGFDNGGVWRSSDYGSTWDPLFDQEPTGSIGADRRRPVESERHLRRHRAPASSAPTSPRATACTSPPTAAGPGRTSDCATRR